MAAVIAWGDSDYRLQDLRYGQEVSGSVAQYRQGAFGRLAPPSRRGVAASGFAVARRHPATRRSADPEILSGRCGWSDARGRAQLRWVEIKFRGLVLIRLSIERRTGLGLTDPLSLGLPAFT